MKNEQQILESIRYYADHAHGEQTRKYSDERYIVHPIRVMELCKTHEGDLPMLAAALLHDVLEDTKIGHAELKHFLKGVMGENAAGKTLQLVVELTDVYVKSDYPYLNRSQRKAKETERLGRTSPQAQTIKYADIIDNCLEIVRHDRSFAGVFLRECRTLLDVMKKGNTDLRERATTVIQAGFDALKSGSAPRKERSRASGL